MLSLKIAFSVVVIISFMVFILFFGRLPTFKNTPIGALNRVFMIHTPRGLQVLDQNLTGGRIWHSTSKWARFLMNERHPTILILFILLMLIPEIMWLPPIWQHSSSFKRVSMLLIIVMPYIFLYQSAFTDPGKVDEKTYDFHSKLYPYDHILFDPGRMCRTCNLIKPARSKHCSVCGYCVSRCDHHCIFINNCVGYNNMSYFLLLLFSTFILTVAGTVIGLDFLLTTIHQEFPAFTLFGWGLTWSQYFTFLSYLLQIHRRVSSITLLTLLTSPLVFGLASYQMYLIYAGTTTNETAKWGDWSHAIRDGNVWGRDMDPRRERDPEFEGRDIGCLWDRQAEMILVRTTDGRPPTVSRGDELEGEGPWEQIHSLRDVENIYDIGFLDNLKDVFFERQSN